MPVDCICLGGDFQCVVHPSRLYASPFPGVLLICGYDYYDDADDDCNNMICVSHLSRDDGVYGPAL